MRFDDFYANVRSKYPTASLTDIRSAFEQSTGQDPVFETAPPRDQFRSNVANQYPDLTDDEIDDKYDEIYGSGIVSEAKRSLLRGGGGIGNLIGAGVQLLQEDAPDWMPAAMLSKMLPEGQKIRDYWQEQNATVPRSAASQGDVMKDPAAVLGNPLWWAAGTPEMVANQAATIGGFMLAGPVGAGVIGGGMEGLQTYGEAKDKGLDHPVLRGTGQGIASGLLNAIPFADKLGRGIGGMLGRGVAEGVTEGLEEYPGTYLETEAAKWRDPATFDTATSRAANIAPLAAVTGLGNAMAFRGPAPGDPEKFADVANELRPPGWVEDLKQSGGQVPGNPATPSAEPGTEKPGTYLPYTGGTRTILPKAEQRRTAVQSALEPIYSKWRGGPTVNIVGSYRDLPKDIQDRFDDSINGAFDGQSNVYLVADKFQSPQEAARVLFHESLGHYSIEQIVPDIADFAAQIERFAPNDPVLSRYWQTVQQDYANGQPLTKSLETVARYAEDFPDTKHPLVERMYSRLREFARNTLGMQINMNRADLNRALRKAMRNLEQGTKGPTAGNALGEARASSPAEAMDLNLVRRLPVVDAGGVVDGRVVREEIPNLDSVGASFDEYTELEGVREIPVEWFDKEYLDSVRRGGVDRRTQRLADEISQTKELNPLIVAFDSKGPYIVEGGHRFDALISMGAKSLPAKVVIDDSDPPANVGAAKASRPRSGVDSRAGTQDTAGKAIGRTRPGVPRTDEPVATADSSREEIGLGGYITEGGQPVTLYHGTRSTFDTFKTGRAGAVYFTPNKSHAQRYGDNVKPVRLKAQNVADLTDPSSEAHRLAVRLFNESGGFSDNPDAMEGRDSPDFDPNIDETWEMFDTLTADIPRELQRAGYDAVKLNEYGGEVSYAVFDPSQIESVSGAKASRPRTTETVGEFSVRQSKDGSLFVAGDHAQIRAAVPADVKGRPVEGGIQYTTSAAPRVRAALEGRNVAYSRGGRVLAQKPMKNGKYVGAPAAYDTPAKIPQLRKWLRKLADEGAPGRFWYENSSREILRMTGGDVNEARRFVALLAIYSPQAKVDGNTTFALRAWAQYKAGQPIKVKTGVQDAKATQALADVDAFWKGEKTGNFITNLLRMIDQNTADKQGATIDTWMMRAGRYSNDAPTATQYAFMEDETNRLAAELGWEPQQVQAAIWVAMKARMENKGVKERTEASSEKKGWINFTRNAKGTKVRNVVDEQAHRDNWLRHAFEHDPTTLDTATAKFDFSDGVLRHIGQMSFEARPGRTTGVLPGIHSASWEKQQAFHAAVRSAMLDENGVDVLAQKLGLFVDAAVDSPGVWQGDVSPSTQTRMAMAPNAGVEDAKSEDKTKTVDPAQRVALDAYAAIVGALARQEAVGWHRPFYQQTKSRSNGLEISIGRVLDPAETIAAERAVDSWMREQGHDDWASSFAIITTPTGIRLINFGVISNTELLGAVNSAVAEVLPDSQSRWFQSDGNLVENSWEKNPNGQEYFDRASASGRPDVLGWVRDVLAPKVQAVFESYAESEGWGEPGDVSKLAWPTEARGPKASRPVTQLQQPTFEERARQSIVRETEFAPEILDAYVSLAKGQEGRIETQRRGVQSWDQTARNAAAMLASDLGFDHVGSLTSAAPGTAANPEALVIMAGAIHEATQRVEAAAIAVQRDKSPANLAGLKAAMDRLAFLQAPWMGFRAEAGRSLNILRKVAPVATNVNDLLDRYVNDPRSIEDLADQIVQQKNQSDAQDPARGVSAEIVGITASQAQIEQELRAIQSERAAIEQERQAAAAEMDPETMATEASALELSQADLTAREAGAKAAESAIRKEIDKLIAREQQLDAALAKAEAQTAENAENKAWLDENKGQLDALRKQNSKDKSALKRQMEGLQGRMQAEVDARAKLDQQLKDLSAKRAELDARRADVSKNTAAVNAKLKRVDAALARVAEREQALLDKQKQLDAKRTELEQRRDAIRRATPQRKRRTTGSIVREKYTPTLGDKFLEYYYNSILSGPATHAVNILGNSAFLATEEIAKQIGLWSTGQGKAAMARLNALTLGIQTGLLNARTAFSTELPQLDQQTKMEVDPERRNAIEGTKGQIIRLPGRALQAEDEFFKGIAYTMSIAELATRAANGDMNQAREIMKNPPQEMQQEAVLAARRTTFTSKLGPSAGALMRFTNTFKPAKLIVPFIQTPVNIVKRAMDYSPFGIAGMMFDTEVGNDLRGRNGPEKRAVAMARQVMGAGLAMTLWQLAAAGLVTGGGPAEPEERTLWRQRDGRDSYSVKIGDKWYSYLRFDPLAIPMGIMADAYETIGILGEKDIEDVAMTVMNSLVNNLANKTWLSGVSSFAEAVNDPQRYGEGFIAMLASGLAVPNIVGQTTNYNDPWTRQARTVLDRVRSRIPGERQELAQKIGISGEPIANNGVTAMGIPTPFRATQATEVDPLADAMLRLGVIKRSPSRNFMGVELEDEEYAEWSSLIQRQRWQYITPIVQSPQFQALPPIQQSSLLEEAWDKFGSNKVLRAQFLMQHPELLSRVRTRSLKAA